MDFLQDRALPSRFREVICVPRRTDEPENTMSDTITCPDCGHQFQMSDALLSQVSARVRADYEARRQKDERSHRQALEDLRQQLEQEQKEALDAERKRARAAATQDAARELELLKEQVAAKDEKLAESRARELELLKARQALETEQEEFELEKARQLDAERAAIKADATRIADERHRLKEAEWTKQHEAMSKQIDELRRKAEQGSQELQGEVQELDLERTLRQKFPLDDVEPVAKGKRGADLLQRVADGAGQGCGCILWESKRAKNWSADWLPKLRDDQRAAKAELAVLVSDVLPAGVIGFGQIDGVWVTTREHASGLALALRTVLQQVAAATRSAEGRQSKMSLLYAYLCGQEFRHRVTGLVEAFTTMRQDLASERAVLSRHWSKREQSLNQALAAASGLYGDVQGIAGAGFPELEQLELKRLGESNGGTSPDSDERDEDDDGAAEAFTF